MKRLIQGKRFAALPGVMAVAVCAALPLHVGAGEEEGAVARYHMKVIGNQAHLAPFQAGEYQRVIEHIERSPVTVGTLFMHANNLCVAHTLAGQYEAARSSCDEAVLIGRRQARLAFNGSVERANLAIALSNRGVFMAVSSDEVAATSDFLEARKVGKSASPAGENLVKLQEGASIAVAGSMR